MVLIASKLACSMAASDWFIIFQLKVVRVHDGRLMAWYTVYEPACSMAVSDWFITLGLTDRRLYVLLLVDPQINCDYKYETHTITTKNSVLTPDNLYLSCHHLKYIIGKVPIQRI